MLKLSEKNTKFFADNKLEKSSYMYFLFPLLNTMDFVI